MPAMSSDNPHRRPLRLPEYDYSQPGAHFVTVCTCDRECILGDVVDASFRPSEFGTVVEQTLPWLPRQFPSVQLDAFSVMPNHLHCVLFLNGTCDSVSGNRTRKPLGRLVGAFKTHSALLIGTARDTPRKPVWQRGYYEHVIRNDCSLDRIRAYLAANPANWELDREHPATTSPPPRRAAPSGAERWMV
jgi:REP element-mobilizing transposase RayT